MEEQVYRELARRLDAIPNGFPATESGVELQLLAKMFTPEEAALAAVMRLAPELATDIAARAGVDLAAAGSMLKGMARKGLIRAGRGEGRLTFGLMPFAVGIYEAQLPRIDAELATLFEQYYQETRGGIAQGAPAIHRVIPVGKAIPAGLEILTYESAFELLQTAQSWGVRDCICRVQQRLVGKGCDRPIENCMVFAPVEGAFDHSEIDRPITRQEALAILEGAEEAGLVHSTGNYRDGHSYICNCCTCCCGVLRSLAEFGQPNAIARSSFFASVDAGTCLGCGDCVDRCQFGALSVPDDRCVVDDVRCVGCGLCATVCPSGALHLKRRPESEILAPPLDRGAWMRDRARSRGISLSDLV
jgi:electron transport complex protein RnfB